MSGTVLPLPIRLHGVGQIYRYLTGSVMVAENRRSFHTVYIVLCAAGATVDQLQGPGRLVCRTGDVASPDVCDANCAAQNFLAVVDFKMDFRNIVILPHHCTASQPRRPRRESSICVRDFPAAFNTGMPSLFQSLQNQSSVMKFLGTANVQGLGPRHSPHDILPPLSVTPWIIPTTKEPRHFKDSVPKNFIFSALLEMLVMLCDIRR
jgi:hypothetical protein